MDGVTVLDVFNVVSQGGDVAVFAILWYCYKINSEVRLIESRLALQVKSLDRRINLLERRVFHGVDKA